MRILPFGLLAALIALGQPSTFKSGVDVVVVDVHVVDKSGKPIADLRPEECEVPSSVAKP
jgi:hypothetical protein